MSNIWEIKAVQELRAQAHAEAIALLKSPVMTAEVRSAFDRAIGEVNKLGAKIEAMERGDGRATVEHRCDPRREAAFARFVRYGQAALEPAEQRMLQAAEQRDVAEGNQPAHIGTYSGLGYLVPTGFVAQIEQATKYFCPMLDSDVSGLDVIKTDTGNALPFPVSDDTANVATIVGEAANVGEQDVTASHVVLGAYKMTSGLIKASIELLQDSAIDIDAWLAQRFGERWGRGLEALLTTGTGVAEPTGILTAIEASGVSPVIAVGSGANDGVGTDANSIGSQDLVNLEHGVDPSYRRGAKYMLHDTILAGLQKLLDKYGRPLWAPGMSSNAPNTLNGYPYIVNQSFPSTYTGGQAGVLAFGDFRFFKVRKVQDLSVVRFNELFMQNGQVGFTSFARIDSNYVRASSTYPLNVLEMHS